MKRKQAPYDFVQFDPVIIEWEDCFADASGQVATVEEAKNSYTPYIRKTLCYFIYADENVVIGATDDDRDNKQHGGFGGLIYTPLGIVRSVTPVIPPKKARATA